MALGPDGSVYVREASAGGVPLAGGPDVEPRRARRRAPEGNHRAIAAISAATPEQRRIIGRRRGSWAVGFGEAVDGGGPAGGQRDAGVAAQDDVAVPDGVPRVHARDREHDRTDRMVLEGADDRRSEDAGDDRETRDGRGGRRETGGAHQAEGGDEPDDDSEGGATERRAKAWAGSRGSVRRARRAATTSTPCDEQASDGGGERRDRQHHPRLMQARRRRGRAHGRESTPPVPSRRA
jgi:hypothetical protein